MILRFPPPDRPWSVNEIPVSVHEKIRQSHRKQAWRDAAYYATRQAGYFRRQLPPSNVQVTIPFDTRRHRDPHNYTGTVVKAIVDGIRLAGVWPDDNADWVTVLDPILGNGCEVVVVVDRRPAVTVLG